MQSKSSPEQIHLTDYWNVLRRRKTLVIIFACAVVAVTTIVSYGMKPVYRASAKMTIERESTSSPVTGQRTESIDIHSQQLSSNTHLKLIMSKPVIEYMLKQNWGAAEVSEDNEGGSPANPIQEALASIENGFKKIKSAVGLQRKVEAKSSEEGLLAQKISRLQGQIKISPVRETRLLYVQVEDEDPVKAAYIANQLAKSYIEYDLASRLTSDKLNLEWLNKEVYGLKSRLEDDERKFYEYKQQNKVFSLEGKQKAIDQKISELNNEYLATKSKRQELEAKLGEINKHFSGRGDISYIRSILDNKTIDDIYASLTGLELELSRLGKVFKSRHPRILQVNSEIAKVSSKLNGELSKEIENLKVQQSIFVNREKDMEAAIREFEEDALDNSSKELEYTILQRNMETSQRLYDTLVAKIKESGIASSGMISNIRIVENAAVPTGPLKPDKKKNLLLGLVFGVFGGIGLAFLMEYFDQTIRTEEDVRNYLGLPVLAVVPVADNAERG